jgi:hypothetical protein
MALRHGTLELTGVAQRLLDEISIDAPAGGMHDIAGVWISLQPGAANSNPIYVGDSTVSATDYGVQLRAPAQGLPPDPFVIAPGGPAGLLRPSNCYVLGTAEEVLHILCVWP